MFFAFAVYEKKMLFILGTTLHWVLLLVWCKEPACTNPYTNSLYFHCLITVNSKAGMTLLAFGYHTTLSYIVHNQETCIREKCSHPVAAKYCYVSHIKLKWIY